MRVYDQIDLRVRNVFRRQCLLQRIVLGKTINVAPLRIPFGATAGLDEDGFTGSANQKYVHRQTDAVTLVRRRDALPERLRHDAEHCAAIEPECSRAKDFNLDLAESHLCLDRPERPLLARISPTAAKGSFFRFATSAASSSNSFSPAAPSRARSSNCAWSISIRRCFQCSARLCRRSSLVSKCLRNSVTVSANASMPLASVATVRTTVGCQPSRGATSESIARSCCSRRSAPSRSALLRTKMSPISIRPAFML